MADLTVDVLKHIVQESGAAWLDQEAFLATVPDGSTVVNLRKESGIDPERTKASEQFISPASFAQYVERFRSDSLMIQASVSAKSIKATLDYDLPDRPSWREHTATLLSVETPEWKALKASTKSGFMPQIEFAEWLEQWSYVIETPTARELVEVAMNLEGSVGAKFESKINRTDGAKVLTYAEEVTTGQVRVPTRLVAVLRPYFASDVVDVEVLIRFRVNGGSPAFALILQNPDRIEQESFLQLINKVSAEVAPVLVGP